MNIRKALDRAKKEREKLDTGTEAGADAAKTLPQTPVPGRTDAAWNAPVYSQSRTVAINMKTAVKNHCVALSPAFAELEYYKVLRTQLRQIGREKNWNTIMVTSVAPGEGKTVTAINLAATFAREYSQTVLLVDADLRRQSIHRYLGYPSDVGLLDCFEEKMPMNDVITWPGVEKFTIVSGGRTVEESSELMGSPRMQAMVTELKSRYDDRTVIFDVPPVMAGADALTFAPLVDCIIMVVGSGMARKPDLMNALEMLPGEKIAGFVLNQYHGANKLYRRYG
jgi:non-specific protein-tyrosine kinase